MSSSVIVRIHLACANRDRQDVRFRRDRTVVVIGIRARRVVREIEIEQEFPTRKLLDVHVAAELVTLLPGRRVAEKDPEIVFADAWLEKTEGFESNRRRAHDEIKPADFVGAPLIAAR